jgi:hypothetical protein
MSIRSRLLRLALCVLSVGCAGNDDIGPAPAGGYNHSQIDYHPPLPNPTVIDIGVIDLSQDPVLVESLSLPEQIATEEPLAFVAEVKPGAGEPLLTLLIVEFLANVPGKGPMVQQQAIGGPDADNLPAEGQSHLRLEMRAPMQPTGKHQVQIKLLLPATGKEPTLIREGEVEIR